MARTKDNRARKHIQVDLPVESFERLNQLKSKTKSGSYTEVFDDALKLYESIVDDILNGTKIMAHEKDGSIIQYKFFF